MERLAPVDKVISCGLCDRTDNRCGKYCQTDGFDLQRNPKWDAE